MSPETRIAKLEKEVETLRALLGTVFSLAVVAVLALAALLSWLYTG